jgi:hypothetical protein
MVSTRQQFETTPTGPVFGLENVIASGRFAENIVIKEFKAKFDHEDTEMLSGLLLLGDDDSNQESSVIAIFNCSPLCARYALMRARSLKQKQEREMEKMQLARKHELDLAKIKCSNLHQPTTKKKELNIADKFGGLIGSPLTEEEDNILLTKFNSFSLSILSGEMTPILAKKILKSIRLVLADDTLQVMQARGYIFDGLLGPVAGGQAILYRVFNLETYQVCCCKVYLKSEEDQRAMDNEIMTNSMIHRTGKKPNIASFDAVLEFRHSQRPVCSIALIMPFYSISLQEVLDAHGSELDINHFKNIAKGLLAAGQCFEECGLSHCDIKPSNIMLEHGSPVVIDFGSVVRLGSAVEEYTRFYALDAYSNPVGSDFDLNCIAVTLAKCFIPQFNVGHRTRQQLKEELEKYRGNLVSYANICIEVLKYPSSSVALRGLQSLLQPLPKSALET